MVRTLLIAAALLAAPGRAGDASEQAGSQSAVPKQGDPSGVYLCEGTNPDGHHYRGIVQIAAVDSTFLVRWTLADNVEVTGVGILHDDQLSVSYFGGTPSVVVYSIGENGRLDGQWTAGGAEGEIFKETLTKMPEGAPKPAKPTKRDARPRSRVTV